MNEGAGGATPSAPIPERIGKRSGSMTVISGYDLIAWGFRPGAWFKRAVSIANALRAEGADDAAIAVPTTEGTF